MRIRKKQALFVIVILFVGSRALCLDTDDLLESHSAFFAQQPPLQVAQTDDDWGTSPAAGKMSEETVGYKSSSRAALYSLLLPGLGEIYVGDSRTRAAGFLAAEAGIWSTFILFRQLGAWKKDDYIEVAVVYAGIDPSGKDDVFYDMIGFYDSRDKYNKVSRVYTRRNPFYPETPEWDWQWSNSVVQEEYRDIKNESKSAYRNANFALGVAALNRAVSMIFAWRSARAHNRNVADEFSGLNLKFLPDYSNRSVEVRVGYTVAF